MLLVGLLSVDPLMVHVTNIALILLAELIHTANKIAALIRQVIELVVKGNFMLTILDFIVSKVL